LGVTAPCGPALAHDSFQVRERLRDGKAALRRAQLLAEEGQRDLVGRPGLVRERCRRLVEASAVVLDQLARPRACVVDRVAVPGVDDARRQLDRALERREVVAERVGATLGIETDGGRDPAQQVVATDENAVAEKSEMAVGVSGKLDDVPTLELTALVQELGVDRVADEWREGVALHDQVVRNGPGDSVPNEPGRHPLRPVFAPPHALALRVVEPALKDRCSRRLRCGLRAAHVVRMEVRDGDPLDLHRVPGRLSEAEAGVEERAVDQVAVDVLRSGRERQGQPLNPSLERYERLFYHGGMVEYREEPCKSALNPVKGMGFKWSLNPYMGCVHRCTFCYVRHFEQRSDRPSGDRYGTSIRVKVNVAEVLRRELARASWEREPVSIGAATDPYQPAEGRYKLTRACLEVLSAAANPFSIITRGPMIVRDLDLLVEASQRADVSVMFSIPTLDDEVWKRTEPSTAHPRQRLKAVKTLVEAGVKAGVGMAPILPGISDKPEQLREVVRAAREAGATGIWANLLFLRPGTREHFLEHLAEDWPEQLPLYERLYAGPRAYLGASERSPIRAEVSALAREYAIRDRRKVRLGPPPEPEQLSLTV